MIRLIRRDQETARAAWVAAAEGTEREDRESSGFLVYRDAKGRVIDFHALRHTYISHQVRNGVNPKIVQQNARHGSITLTMDSYTHVDLAERTGALARVAPLGARRYSDVAGLSGNGCHPVALAGTASEGKGAAANSPQPSTFARSYEDLQGKEAVAGAAQGAGVNDKAHGQRVRGPGSDARGQDV
jgi:hypothetical protein